MPKSGLKQVTIKRTKMEIYTEACYPCKITRTNHFPRCLRPQYMKLILSDFHDFKGISDAFFSFFQSVNNYLYFSHIDVTQIIKGN